MKLPDLGLVRLALDQAQVAVLELAKVSARQLGPETDMQRHYW